MSNENPNNPFSINIVKFPDHLLIPQTKNILTIQLRNNLGTEENFNVAVESEKLESEILPSEFKEKMKISPGKSKLIEFKINPKGNGIGTLKIDVFHLKKVQYTVKVEKIREKNLDFEVVPLKLKYPQGDEKQLLKSITGREVPSGGLPIEIGAVVSNVGTVFAIYEAVVYNKPLIERVVTVTGGAVAQPANLKVRIGTKIEDLIEECGGLKIPPKKIIAGGPMMGFAQVNLDSPVTKGVSGIIALPAEAVQIPKETPCIRCGRCIEACPMGLSPTRLYKWIDHQYIDEALKEGLMDCKECGSCGFVCPAGIPLVQGMKLGKLLARKKRA